MSNKINCLVMNKFANDGEEVASW